MRECAHADYPASEETAALWNAAREQLGQPDSFRFGANLEGVSFLRQLELLSNEKICSTSPLTGKRVPVVTSLDELFMNDVADDGKVMWHAGVNAGIVTLTSSAHP